MHMCMHSPVGALLPLRVKHLGCHSRIRGRIRVRVRVRDSESDNDKTCVTHDMTTSRSTQGVGCLGGKYGVPMHAYRAATADTY